MANQGKLRISIGSLSGCWASHLHEIDTDTGRKQASVMHPAAGGVVKGKRKWSVLDGEDIGSEVSICGRHHHRQYRTIAHLQHDSIHVQD